MRALTVLVAAALLLALATADADTQSTQYDEAVGGGRGPWDAVADDASAKVSTDVVKDPRDPACYDCALLRRGGVRPATADAAAAVRGGSGVRAPSVGGCASGGGAIIGVGGPQLAPAPAPSGAHRRHGLVTG